MKLKQYLKKVKLSSRDFADFLGINRSSFSGIVSGRRVPSKNLAKRISAATLNKVTVDEIFPEDYNNTCPCCGQRLKRKKL